MADEGLHEIQLNGKQLVFLFMASTVVAVVIFLCGVMVGRGVRAQRPAEAIEASVDAAADPTAPIADTAPPVSAAATSSNSSNTPVASSETLTYPERLEGSAPPEETLKAVGTAKQPAGTASQSAPKSPAVVKNAPPSKDAPSAKSTPATVPSASAAASEPVGNGFVVQVAAVNDRGEADTIAKRLAGKGYPTFVTAPGNGAPRMFRVRIGKYPSRRDAEAIAARLEKEEQFKPWITK
jgi:cell division septation protein DedD